jgi:signal peptidase II
MSKRRLVAVMLGVGVVDQLTKVLAIAWLRGRPPIYFPGDLFRLEYAENPGAFLSLGAGLSDTARFWTLSILVAVFLVATLVYTFRARDLSAAQRLGFALLLGGGFSNLVDRLFRANGRVIDYMNMGIGGLRTGIFNVADVAIMGGIAVALFWPRRDRR